MCVTLGVSVCVCDCGARLCVSVCDCVYVCVRFRRQIGLRVWGVSVCESVCVFVCVCLYACVSPSGSGSSDRSVCSQELGE